MSIWPDREHFLIFGLHFASQPSDDHLLTLGRNTVAQKFRVKQHVQWNYGSGTATGQIKESFKEKVTRTIKGSEITRNASEDEPAYLIEQEDGDEVLKSESELTSA